ncbi:hypothetical protein FB45DRAFT_1115144 [Roridomyces roridus]|uniref:PDZ GRASP-type domain-containing protein n=1 Tax=Roridomyces roridus TaxID=1738132 RepID=A0AAD7CB69_9AGAR|nr:hypothetical protein FB45DRAFT_1115144 [Roridomyces roridus]
MGASQSTQFAAPPSRALHVLRVTPTSPASKTSIEPLFDFVVGFEGDALASHNAIDAAALERIVEGHEGRTLNLLVWNAKSQETRVVPIVPSRAWSQPDQNDSNAQPSLLGLSMRMCQPEISMDNVWHVLDVQVTHVDKPLRVYVYSHDFDALREVVLVPNRHWGGEGLLGCMYGLLHRIPPQPAERLDGNSTPPELRDNADEYEEQELFVPADIPQEPPTHLDDWRRQQQDEWATIGKPQGGRGVEQQPFRPTLVTPIEEEESSDSMPVNEDPVEEYHHDHAATPTASPPGPPRRTASFNHNADSALRSSRGTIAQS